jgi:hypothetical protein
MDNNPDLLRQLETLRRQLENVDHSLGSAYDYIDRGMPNDDERQDTWEKIEGWRREEAHLKGQLTQLVTDVRQNNPDVIDRWADLHKTFYMEIKTRYEGADKFNVPSPEIANIFIESALKKWEQVSEGEKDYVLSIYSFISQHEDIYEKIFGD